MRVLMTLSKLEPSENGIYVGGSVNSVLNLIKGLGYRSVSTILLTCIPASKIKIFNTYKPVNINCSLLVNNQKPQSVRYGVLYLIKSVFWAFFKSSRSIELLHGHAGFAIYSWVTYISSLIIGCPGVQTIYCPVNMRSTRVSFKNLILSSKIAYFPLCRMDKVIAMSTNVCESLISAGVEEKKIEVIPNGVDTDEYSVDRFASVKIREKLGLSSKSKIILFAGNLMPSKGVDILIEAIAQLVNSAKDEIKLVIALELEHEGFEQKLNELKAQIKNLGADDYIIWLNIIDYMPQLMAASNLVVIPYRDTNGPSDYPLVLMEAMSTGACVVGTDVGGISELIDNNITGRLVAPDNIDELARVMIELLADEDSCREMGIKAREKIIECYSVNKIVERHLAVYEEVRSNNK